MSLVSAGRRLDFHLARAPASAARDATRNGVVIAHEMPAGPASAASAGSTFPQLADRIAQDTGWAALSFAFRGAGKSPGMFSPQGWLDDLKAAVDLLRAEAASVWLAGFGFGGTLALRATADDPTIGGVAALGAPVDFSGWKVDPSSLAAAAHEAGLVDSATPDGLELWAAELDSIDPLGAARLIAPRPLLVVHGSTDERVPQHDARALVDAADGHGEFRIIAMAGTGLRHDPRAIALLLGWLERHSS
jgi:putative redox protein